MAHYYGIVLHLYSKATYNERISTEAFHFVYQNLDKLRPDFTNFALTKFIPS